MTALDLGQGGPETSEWATKTQATKPNAQNITKKLIINDDA
jgi:hypothetical protein